MASKEMLDSFERAVEAAGGPEEMARRMDDFSRRSDVMNANRKQWTTLYPYKWVALSDDDALTVGDDLDDLLRKLDEAGKRRTGLVVKYLDPNPPVRHWLPPLLVSYIPNYEQGG